MPDAGAHHWRRVSQEVVRLAAAESTGPPDGDRLGQGCHAREEYQVHRQLGARSDLGPAVVLHVIGQRGEDGADALEGLGEPPAR